MHQFAFVLQSFLLKIFYAVLKSDIIENNKEKRNKIIKNERRKRKDLLLQK